MIQIWDLIWINTWKRWTDMTKEEKFIYLLSVIWTFFLWSHLVILLLSTNWHLQVDTATCRLMLTLTGWCWHLQVDTDTYRLILRLTGWYWHLQVDTDTYRLILTLTGWYWHLQVDTDTYRSVWHQTHYDATDKNYNTSFEGLYIHYYWPCIIILDSLWL